MAKRTDLDKLRQLYEKSTSGGGGFTSNFWKPKDGENIIRILPPDDDEDVFYKETGAHSVRGQFFLWCPRLESGKKCPFCEETRRRYNAGTDLDVEIGRKIKSRKLYLYNIVDRKDEEDPNKVHVYMSGKKVWEKILSYYFDEDYGALDDVDSGYDFKLIKKTQGEFPNYDDSRPLPKPSPLSDDKEEVASILSSKEDLSSFVEVKSYDELKSQLEDYLGEFYGETIGGLAAETQEEKAEEKPKPAKPSKKSKPDKKEPEPEVEDEETDDSEEDLDDFQRKLEEALTNDEED